MLYSWVTLTQHSAFLRHSDNAGELTMTFNFRLQLFILIDSLQLSETFHTSYKPLVPALPVWGEGVCGGSLWQRYLRCSQHTLSSQRFLWSALGLVLAARPEFWSGNASPTDSDHLESRNVDFDRERTIFFTRVQKGENRKQQREGYEVNNLSVHICETWGEWRSNP